MKRVGQPVFLQLHGTPVNDPLGSDLHIWNRTKKIRHRYGCNTLPRQDSGRVSPTAHKPIIKNVKYRTMSLSFDTLFGNDETMSKIATRNL